MSSPTQRSLAMLRKDGWLVDIVERRAGRFITKDCWGFVDLLALRGDEILAVQTTSYANLSSRVKKITDHENLDAVRKAGIAIHAHGWKKGKTGRWECVVRDLS